MISSKLKSYIYSNVISSNKVSCLKHALNSNPKWLRKSILVYAIHNAVERDQLRLCEDILNLCNDPCEREEILNSKYGRHGYLPICRAAYNLSIKALKFLAIRGADITREWKNKHNEDIFEVMNQGHKTRVNEMPECEIFLNQNRDSCVDFMNRFLER